MASMDNFPALAAMDLGADELKVDQYLLDWIKKRISLAGYHPSMWNAEHTAIASEFLLNPGVNKLLMFIDKDNELCLSTLSLIPSKRLKRIQYFLKPAYEVTLTRDNVVQMVQYGLTSGTPTDSLLMTMNGVFLPTFLHNATWPESIRKEFAGQLHKFMASLTEIANQVKGHTVLYLPTENIDINNIQEAAQDKDLIQRLETLVIHWTRQIKEVVNNQETSAHVDNSGPLEEIEFWRSRTLDLSGIRQQLDRPGVQSIVSVLATVHSSYLKPFLDLSDKIQKGSIEANNNLKFLSTLQPSCEALSKAEPAAIPALLPEVLNLIRMIWTISKFYNTHERLTGLLRKVSTQIIVQCSKKISLSEIFDGDVEQSMVLLNQSIACGEAWHRIYDRTVLAIQHDTSLLNEHGQRRLWDFDPATHGIFAQIDAFIQRCHNLKEVCEGQMQFARRTSAHLNRSQKADLPSFGGSRGAEIEKSLYEIEEAFGKHIDRLRHLDYDILNVKATNWHYDYSFFKNGLKDLEVMMVNVMSSAWDGVSSVSDGVQLLEAFHHLAVRSNMRQNVERKTTELYQLFVAELEWVKGEFLKRKKEAPVLMNQPRYAGTALWAKALLMRIQHSHASLASSSHYLLPATPTLIQTAQHQFSTLQTMLKSFMMQTHEEYKTACKLAEAEVPGWLGRLEVHLMKRSSVGSEETHKQGPSTALIKANPTARRAPMGHLELHFDRQLLRMFAEGRAWEKFAVGEFPKYQALEMYPLEEPLRVLREWVMLVVRDYNRIIDALGVDERRLFAEHLRRVDRKISPGLNKLTWSEKHIKDWFVRVSRAKCHEVLSLVQHFQLNSQRIAAQCARIASLHLLELEKNVLYDDVTFEQKQQRHQQHVRAELTAAYSDIMVTLQATQRYFADQFSEPMLAREWQKYIRKTDLKLETALRTATKRALTDLSRAINGDAKNEAHPIFRLQLDLDDAKGSLEFRPSLPSLTAMVVRVCKDSLTTLEVVPRLTESFGLADQGAQANEVKFHDPSASAHDEPNVKSASFYFIISNDNETLRAVSQITAGCSQVANELNKLQHHYTTRYSKIWSEDKASFLRRYAASSSSASSSSLSSSLSRPLSSYEVDISKYKNLQSDIQAEDASHTVQFLRIDTTPIKTALVNHCQQWQLQFTGLLHHNATTELYQLHDLFVQHTEQLRHSPHTLEQLAASMQLLKDIHEGKSSIEARFAPLEESYAVLDKFDVHVQEEEKELLEHLKTEWQHYLLMLNEASAMLQSKKIEMRKDLEDSLSNYSQQVLDTRTDFKEHAPFTAPDPETSASSSTSSSSTVASSAASSSSSMDKEKEKKEKENEPDLGAAFAFIASFKQRIHDNRQKALHLQTGMELFHLTPPEYKETEETERELMMLERVWLLMKEWLDKWQTWKNGQFSSLSVSELDNEAQHYQRQLNKMGRGVRQWGVWRSLSSRVTQFRQTMPLIENLRSPAMRPRHWAQLQSDLHHPLDPQAPTFTLGYLIELGVHLHADTIANLASVASRELSIETQLQDIASSWQGLKLDLVIYKSKYYKIRSMEEINDLHEQHSVLLSTMKNSAFYLTFHTEINYWVRSLNDLGELLDLMLQLQRQWSYLESIFMDSAEIRKQLPRESSLFEGVNGEWMGLMNKLAKTRLVMEVLEGNLLEPLSRMNETLAQINHSLGQFLEKKRQQFSRFYFLSDEDLLEILGQSRDPMQVQKHIHKCFAGIKTFELARASSGRLYEITGVQSSEGELVKLNTPVLVDGEIETWLTTLDTTLQDTLHKQLYIVLASVQKVSHKRSALQSWLKSSLGQIMITSGQIAWTAKCHAALVDLSTGKNKRALKRLKNEWDEYLKSLAKYVREPLTEQERLKLNALITIETHARDVIDKLKTASKGKLLPSSFEWTAQLRFYWERPKEPSASAASNLAGNTLPGTAPGTGPSSSSSNVTDASHGRCVVKQTNTRFHYGYEYLGNGSRLVVTPLTDRCYITLTTALHLYRGGSPQGPAGTGKTETIKDLAKNLAKFAVVFNCSPDMTVEPLARNFAGLAQTGAWGVFDEFNRIEIEVLSVVALQIASILEACRSQRSQFIFDGRAIKLDRTVGIFITMNPSYAGRSELPENLQTLFRPVAMMEPEAQKIAEIMLFSEGFREAAVLAGKLTALYDVMVKQLSKQPHYNYGLRAIKSVLIRAGVLYRQQDASASSVAASSATSAASSSVSSSAMSEEMILLQALRDMNASKLVEEDVALFEGLLSDLFPNMEMPSLNYSLLKNEIERQLSLSGLQVHDHLVQKIIQLYETKNTRHGNMLVGETCSGKSTAWKILAKSLTSLAEREKEEKERERERERERNRTSEERKNEGLPPATSSSSAASSSAASSSTASSFSSASSSFQPVDIHILNPKSIDVKELFGYYDPSTKEWHDGVLSRMMRRVCNDESKKEKWVMLDGPVDTLWIESMNSLLDDTKQLTLINGDRISLPPQVSVMFEVQDLNQATPATVSRCGMVYMEREKLGWRPMVMSWLSAKMAQTERKEQDDALAQAQSQANMQALNMGVMNTNTTATTTVPSAGSSTSASPSISVSASSAAASSLVPPPTASASSSALKTASLLKPSASATTSSSSASSSLPTTILTRDAVELLQKLFDKYVVPLLAFRKDADLLGSESSSSSASSSLSSSASSSSSSAGPLKEPIPITEFNAVQSLIRLFDAFVTVDNGVDAADEANYLRMIEMWFTMCCVWSIGGALDEPSRKRFDAKVRDLEAQFPPLHTCYEYYVDPHKKDWALWEEKVNASWRPNPSIPFHRLLVPTVDTVRHQFLLNALLNRRLHTLVVGGTGTGKTSITQALLDSLDPSQTLTLSLNFSSATSSEAVQEMIESRLEKRQRNNFGPLGARSRLITFIDDLNMPKKTEFGSQPPIELLRQWMDYGFWYDRSSGQKKHISDMQLLAAMGPPGGARSEISARFQSRFNVLHFVFPADPQVKRIFRTLIAHHLSDFDEAVKPLGPLLTQATLELYKQVSEEFLPTPSCSHYLFNMRDMSKVFQGLLLADPKFYDTKESILRLWVHESSRVFHDRLVSEDDRDKFTDVVNTKLQTLFETSWKKLFKDGKKQPLFSDFLDDEGHNAVIGVEDGKEDRAPYQELTHRGSEVKKFLEDKLRAYNLDPHHVPQDLVLFDEAIQHTARIYRIITQPRGSAMLVGLGGSGRQSLTRLAAYVAGYRVKQVEVSKNYRLVEFREDLKELYKLTGVEQDKTVFLLSDEQITQESFLEDVNNILTSGEVPKLFPPDELGPILDQLRPEASKQGRDTSSDALYAFFLERVRHNLHVVLCMSPVGVAFRNRIRMFPALVNCCTIDWFNHWPDEALKEVAARFLHENVPMSMGLGMSLGVSGPNAQIKGKERERAQDKDKEALAQVFCLMHTGALEAAARMQMELKRTHHITPTKYLDLVKGYRALVNEKRVKIGQIADKLRNGLNKLETSREQVKAMSVQLEEKKKVVQQKKITCDKLLVEIVQKQRAAEEQKKQVELDHAKFETETLECKQIQTEAQSELDKVTPALDRAVKALEKLSKSAVTEVKSYPKPPKPVEKVMAAVMVVLEKEPTWASAKRELSDPNFLHRLQTFDRDNISNATLKQIGKYTKQKDFNYDEIEKVSVAAGALCDWVCAIELYAKVFRDVEPRRIALRKAEAQLSKKEEQLLAAEAQLAEVTAAVAKLDAKFQASDAEKNELRREAKDLEAKLTRAAKLVEGLSGERERWEASIKSYESDVKNLVGDCAAAAAFLSYAGPFPSHYRRQLLEQVWLPAVRRMHLPYSGDQLSMSAFLAERTDVMDWHIQGLPSDEFSTENGVLVTRGYRWPLMIDPQGQANLWIKAREGEALKVLDVSHPSYVRQLENAIQVGAPVLLQDMPEELDPILDPLFRVTNFGDDIKRTILFADKELSYNTNFRLYITSKVQNPNYRPEVFTKTTVVNFAVKEKGLQDQLLGIVVKMEEPKLESDKAELAKTVAAGKRKLVELEDQILSLLKTAGADLIEDEGLIEALQLSKATSEEVKQKLQVSEKTEKKIDTAREAYRPCAVRASICFFVLNDLATVDPMYQFSLRSYIDLFKLSIQDSKEKGEDRAEHVDLPERIAALNNYHTEAVYKYACRALFERHKLLFSFQLCVQRLRSESKIDEAEYDFFLRGGQVLDRSMRAPNPCADWLPDSAWDNVTELEKLPAFKNLTSSFEQNSNEWKAWYLSDEPPPEKLAPPGEWQNKRNDFQQLLLLRCLRRDRLVFACRAFIAQHLGPQFVDSPALHLPTMVKISDACTPLIFVLSPGVDPNPQLQALARQLGQQLEMVALGQGQTPIALQMLEAGVRHGNWVYLANCHLSVAWLPELEKWVERLALSKQKPHPNFRLWLSSDPHPKFPVGLLQNSVKMTTEPPRGLKANLLRLYNQMSEEQFNRSRKPEKYKKLLFALCFFHSIVVERRKFLSLGWNVPYAFNDSDFSVCENLLCVYLDEYEETPWEALKYLIAQCNYGGRVTDNLDRRLLSVYINQYFTDSALTTPKYQLSSIDTYIIPEDGSLESYRKYIRDQLPGADQDPPEAFGQHPNADIASQVEQSKDLLNTILSLQPRQVSQGGKSREQQVMELITQLMDQVPSELDRRSIQRKHDEKTPLNTVLLQEVDRYNQLLSVVHQSLRDLQKGIKGLVVISPELEVMFECLFTNTVPPAWQQVYPSLKPLGSWVRDLVERITQLRKWGEDEPPKVFKLSGFTFPIGFLTAVLQTSARKAGSVAIDTLSFDFIVQQSHSEQSITMRPKEGVYISGLYLEGARWDETNGCLAEPYPLELYSPLPIILFKPIPHRKTTGKGLHPCPLYSYPVRSSSGENASFLLEVDLKSGPRDSQFWTKRGVALLLSLDH